MRGRGRSLHQQQQLEMSLQKQTAQDESPRMEGNAQEDEDKEEFSSSLLPPTSARGQRRRDGENKSQPQEMTEEEMMDLAMRLSEQEASVTASRLQQEEEAMMKAIQESMFGQTQLCPPSHSQSLLTDAETSLRICTRRKLLYSDGKMSSALNQGASEDDCPQETDLNQAKRTGDENNNRNKKWTRKDRSPLPEMPDLSQSQKIYSLASPCSSESLSVPLDSPQSSDSTQIDDCQSRKSPVFPLTGCRAKVCVPRLSQDLLETCKTSGFVLCSQDTWTSTRKSQPKSQTFPKSPSSFTVCRKSPVFSDTDQGDGVETELIPECDKSPVFGRSAQNEGSPFSCKPQVCENSGFVFFSQDSLSSTLRSTSCRPKSPVFPRSPSFPNIIPPRQRSAICKSPAFKETDREQTEQSSSCSTSSVFCSTGQQQRIRPDVKNSPVASSDGELRGSNGEVKSPGQDKTDHSQDGRFNKITTSPESDAAQELNEKSKDCNSTETELTSDMTLMWSDEDENNITPVGSPSPVFPEERPVRQADGTAAASPQMTGSNCRQQLSQGAANGPLTTYRDPAGGPTVHYYWGIPFCPRGLDPDSYTQVIVAQFEVYEKSLKEARRHLLRKAKWGDPILPLPQTSHSPESPAGPSEPRLPPRRGLRLRGKRQQEAGDSSPAEAEEEGNKEEEEKTEKEEKEKNEGGEDEESDCEVCPETQLSDNDGTQDLTMAPDNGAQLQPGSPELPHVEMILRDDSPAADQKETEEEMEVDVTVDRKMQENTPVCRSVGGQNVRKEEMEDDTRGADVEEVKDQKLQRSASPELEPVASPPESNIDCPICQGSFPVTEIEIHAAYCDGEVAVVNERRPEVNSFQTSLKPRRKRTRRADVTDEDTHNPSNIDRNQEKCYICQKAVPLRDYSHHTERCIQQQASKTDTKGNLLSALEQTENMESEAGPSKLQPGDVIDLRDDDEDDSVSEFRISNSPIRSFTPISEAADCLIDFKKQQRAKKPSRRRR
ncbi:BRCA1-A complex subunit RAP80 isoform X3 [Anabas testudineus]|uniref:BRCA1-A complex subunit RAP80 isoform X3 n=1 Tax=Anabas testudineus TaxID=64144 RepID=UPI000E46324D|nr:BRCA1-A complex subunit RAP80 isoform X3 [Anabas testudineus]